MYYIICAENGNFRLYAANGNIYIQNGNIFMLLFQMGNRNGSPGNVPESVYRLPIVQAYWLFARFLMKK
jgi:hypothetical protein